jgi:hypothetical protein
MSMAWQDYDMKKVGLFALAVFIVICAVFGSFFSIRYYRKYKQAEKRLRDASVVAQEDVKILLDKVGKLVKLPEGEIPTVATVSDIEKLKNQEFFAKAKVGYRVLLYSQAKKAVLYDPIENKVVEMGPLIIPSGNPIQSQENVAGITAVPTLSPAPSATSAPATPTTNPSDPIKVALYNGTEVTGLTNSYSVLFKEKVPAFDIFDKSSAAGKFAKTIIIDLSGKFTSKISEIAKTIGAEISAMPNGEKLPKDADFLIIIGEDKIKDQT